MQTSIKILCRKQGKLKVCNPLVVYWFKDSTAYIKWKQSKKISYNWIIKILQTKMTSCFQKKSRRIYYGNKKSICSKTPGCGKLFRILTTTLIWKLLRGTRLIVVPNGKKVKNQTIRRLFSKLYMTQYEKVSTTGKVLV